MPPIRREDISPVVTPVRNLGKQFWWKLGIAIVLVFMISKAMSTSDNSGIVNQYPDQEQSQVIDQTTASDETGTNDPYIYDPYSIEENSDASGNFEPDSAQTDVLSQEESGIDAGATGDLGNP